MYGKGNKIDFILRNWPFFPSSILLENVVLYGTSNKKNCNDCHIIVEVDVIYGDRILCV